MAAEILILANEEYVAVHLPNNSLVYERGSKGFTDAPYIFSTSRREHAELVQVFVRNEEDPETGTVEPVFEELSGGRWSRLPRREADPWYHRALKYIKNLERKVVEPKIAQGA